MSITNGKKQKIAIFGGGMSGLTAAHELTNYKGWDEKYEVTLYQMGWRLGGKCSTGRGKNGRIEEHGIHVFLGFYNNAFRLIRESFNEWKDFTNKENPGLNPGLHYLDKEWTDLFIPQDNIILPEYYQDEQKWLEWGLIFPNFTNSKHISDRYPGYENGGPSKQTNTKKMILLMIEMILGSPYHQKNRGCLGSIIHNLWQKLWPDDGDSTEKRQTTLHYSTLNPTFHHNVTDTRADVEKEFGHLNIPIEEKFLMYIQKLVGDLPESEEEAKQLHHNRLANNDPHPHHKIAGLFHEYVSGVEKKIVHLLDKDPGVRRFWTMIQMGWVALKGLIEIYDPATGTYDFESINHLDFREWMKQLGAHDNVIWSAPIKDIYTLVFAYPNGDTSVPGQIEAGTALLGGMLIVLGYKGSVLWRFAGGTADVIVSPIYQVLKKRGVDFKFFHEVEQIHYAENGEIEKVTIGKQVNLKSGLDEFNPIQFLKGLYVWAEHPFWQWDELANQIDPTQLEALKNGNNGKGTNLLSAWSGWKNETFEMTKGNDFDQIVLAIPVDGLKFICKEIIEKDKKWKDMVDNVKTVQTQAVQLWLKKDLKELGFDYGKWGIEEGDLTITDTYANPINSWSDFTDLIKWENWPEGNTPKSLAYFCGPLLEEDPLPPFTDTSFPDKQYNNVIEMTKQWLSDNAGFLWPDGASKENPTGLDLQLLVDPDFDPSKSSEAPVNTGIALLRKQFFKANIDPAERYTLSVPNSSKYRMETDGTGFKNLFVCGDWIACIYNMGCVEATVISGLLAAQALRRNCYGLDEHQPIFRDL